MRHINTQIVDTILNAVRNRFDGFVVVVVDDVVTPLLRALGLVRSYLQRHFALGLAELHAFLGMHMRPITVGSPDASTRYCAGTLRTCRGWRGMKPTAGASISKS